MDRIETLLQKLQTQFNEGATVSQLLLTVQMLQHELLHLQLNNPDPANKEAVSISMPVGVAPVSVASPAPSVEKKEVPKVAQEEKIIQVLQIDEAEVEAELEEIKKNAAAIQKISYQSKPQLLFESIDDDVPTLRNSPAPTTPQPSATKEINESVAAKSPSLNDKLKEIKVELSDRLTDAPVKDLKKVIGINDRFLYINELFRGDESMYERSIKTINSFSIWPEAEYWIRRELKTKLGWSDDNATVKQFDQLIKRRFS